MARDYRSLLTDYWENAHADCDIAKLTGANLRSHLDNLCVTLKDADTVLCIGIGTGGWVNELAEMGPEVWSLDISREANKKVASCIRCINDAGDLPTDYFDLALSQWVAPHMHREELGYQLGHVIRSLTTNGVFAVHYNEPYPPSDSPEESMDKYASAADGVVRITRSDFSSLVREQGGTPFIANYSHSPLHKLTAVAAHIRKNQQGSTR
jgi:SAM-dependent methyltransferase